MVNLDILNELIKTIDIEKLKSAFNMMNVLFGILGTILTCLGVPLLKLFISLLDFKNRKTVKYVMCKRVLGKLNKDFWIRYMVPIGEVIWFLLTPCIMLVIIYIVLFLVNIITICTFNGEKSSLIVFILLIGVLIAGFLGKKLKQSKKDNYIKFLFLIGYSLFSFIYIVYSYVPYNNF